MRFGSLSDLRHIFFVFIRILLRSEIFQAPPATCKFIYPIFYYHCRFYHRPADFRAGHVWCLRALPGKRHRHGQRTEDKLCRREGLLRMP